MNVSNMNHYLVGIIFMSLLIGLFVNVYSGPGGIVDNYGINSGDNQTLIINGTSSEGNILYQLESMNFIAGPQRIRQSIVKLNPAVSNGFDLLGGFLGLGLGVIQTVMGTITMPFELTNIIVGYYAGNGLGLVLGSISEIIALYVAWIYLKKFLGG